jgi:hypothetical protein
VQRSPDGRAEKFTVMVTASEHSVTTVDSDAVKAIRQAVDEPASRAGDGVQVAVTGRAR